MIVLLALRLSACGHPWPVHPDESEFVAAIGFPRPYPVHPPGYPLWVALGTLLTKAGLSPYVAYQSMSVAASCIGPAVLYWLLRDIVGGAMAWWAGFALGVNPVWWFEGVTALNYSAANCLALMLVAAFWLSIRQPITRHSQLAVMVGGICIGLLRPDFAIWLWLLAIGSLGGCRSRGSIRTLASLGLGVLLCVVVRDSLAGGTGSQALQHTLRVVWSTSVFSRGIVDGVCRNAVKLGVYLVWGLGLGFAVLLWSIVRLIRVGELPTSTETECRARFLILWLGPVLTFQLLVHVTELGHSLWYLPAIYSVVAVGLATLRSRRLAVAVLGCISAASIAQFYFYPWRSDVTGWRRVLNAKVAFASAQGLARIDQRELIHRPNDYWTVPGGDTPRR